MCVRCVAALNAAQATVRLVSTAAEDAWQLQEPACAADVRSPPAAAAAATAAVAALGQHRTPGAQGNHRNQQAVGWLQGAAETDAAGSSLPEGPASRLLDR